MKLHELDFDLLCTCNLICLQWRSEQANLSSEVNGTHIYFASFCSSTRSNKDLKCLAHLTKKGRNNVKHISSIHKRTQGLGVKSKTDSWKDTKAFLEEEQRRPEWIIEEYVEYNRLAYIEISSTGNMSLVCQLLDQVCQPLVYLLYGHSLVYLQLLQVTIMMTIKQQIVDSSIDTMEEKNEALIKLVLIHILLKVFSNSLVIEITRSSQVYLR